MKDRRGGNAIDIVVADDADAGLGGDGFGKTYCPLLHVFQGGGLRHEASDCWVQKSFGFIKADTARSHDAAQNFRQFVALSDGLGEAFVLQARRPAPSAY